MTTHEFRKATAHVKAYVARCEQYEQYACHGRMVESLVTQLAILESCVCKTAREYDRREYAYVVDLAKRYLAKQTQAV